MKHTAYLLLGSNLGDRLKNLSIAVELISKTVGEIKQKSGCYETAPWGKTDQPAFINQAVALATDLQPIALLDRLLAIELQMGRQRKEKWGERVIDIDIIFFDDEVIIHNNRLTLPHPQLQYRRFVLEPLNEIASDYEHPILKKNVYSLLCDVADNLEVKRI